MIAVICPSRGRPQNIVDLIEAWEATRSEWADLHIVLDDDDDEMEGYQAHLHPQRVPSWVKTWVGPRRRLGGSLNHLAPHLAQYMTGIGFMGDDHRPRTADWDLHAIKALDRSAVVYGNDLVQGAELPTAVFMDARIVRTLGHFVLPGQIHLWMDNYWKTLGEQLGTLRYLPDVIIEHVHPITGKVPWDEHYTANNASDVWENDERIYKEWVAHQMPADIAKVKAALL